MMKTLQLTLLASVAATPLFAQETREMDAHVHGVSTLELAIEDGMLELSLLSPGMDIVGFEYEANSDADKDAVEAAIRALLVPENVVTLPDAADCRLTEVLAHLHSDDHAHEDADDHMHEGEGEDHDHDQHAEEAGHDDHAEGENHAEGAEHDHEEGARHSEFHASYSFSCAHPEDLTIIGLPFFDTFENAQEIEAQYVTDAGAGTAEIRRDAPDLTLN
ncbi:zinc uptake protein ZrgA [Thalassococcus profundi]|nr:DUF2796 domain-containing protein [Thalassococcus profundi]